MQVKGRDYQLLNDALVNAFGFDSLDAMLQFGLGVRTDRIVGRGTDLDAAVFQLIEEYNRLDQVEKLVQAARTFNPTNGQLHEVAQSLGRATQVTAHIADDVSPVGASELEKLVRRRVPKMKAKETREQMMRVEGQMCVIERHLGGGKGKALGSGFLIGPDAVLTNYHVVNKYLEGDAPLTLQVRFDALLQEEGVRQPEEGVIVAVDEIVDVYGPYTVDDPLNLKKAPAANELDFAILLLAEEAGHAPVGGVVPMQSKSERGWIAIPQQELLLEEGDPLIIYQYPGGRELMMAIDTEAVVGTVWDGMRLRYRNNTEPGSSGSPVFDLDWQLVALHHSGAPGPEPADYNEGIPIARIKAYLEEKEVGHLLGE